jgi:hypothetical protein
MVDSGSSRDRDSRENGGGQLVTIGYFINTTNDSSSLLKTAIIQSELALQETMTVTVAAQNVMKMMLQEVAAPGVGMMMMTAEGVITETEIAETTEETEIDETEIMIGEIEEGTTATAETTEGIETETAETTEMTAVEETAGTVVAEIGTLMTEEGKPTRL